MAPDSDSLSLSIPLDKTGQSREGHSKTGKGLTKTVKDVLKQERMVLNRKIMF